MTPTLEDVTARIACLTSTKRSRSQDAIRIAAHGGTASDLRSRMQATADTLSKVAAKLQAELQ